MAQEATQSQLTNYFTNNLKWIDAKSYGATGDGVTDDSTAIQNAINALAGYGGGVLYLNEDSTFIIGTLVSFGSGIDNVSIVGHKSAILKCSTTYTGTNTAMLKVTGGENITFYGFTIDGDRTNHVSYSSGTNNENTAVHGIYLQTHENITIEDIDFINISKDGVYVNTSSAPNLYTSTSNIRGCTFNDIGRSSIVFIEGKNIHIQNCVSLDATNTHFDFEPNGATETVQNVTITNCVGVGSTRYAACFGMATSGVLDHIEISNCYFNGLGAGIGGHASISNITIKDNIMLLKTTTPSKNIIQAVLADKITFTGNYIEDVTDTGIAPANLIYLRDCMNIIFENNTLVLKECTGFAVAGARGATPDITRYTYYHGSISDNKIYGSASVDCDGITGTDNYRINGNEIYGNSHIKNGITLGHNQTACDNRIYGCTTSGIYITSAGAKAINNQLTSCSIYLRFSTESLISGNKITGTGITLRECSNIRVVDNFVSGSASNGIYLYANAVNIIIANNTIKNSTGSAIRAFNTYAVINGNRCYDDQDTKTQTYGLTIESGADYLVINGNDFTGNKTGEVNGSCTNYRPNPNGTFSTDMGNFNL